MGFCVEWLFLPSRICHTLQPALCSVVHSSVKYIFWNMLCNTFMKCNSFYCIIITICFQCFHTFTILSVDPLHLCVCVYIYIHEYMLLYCVFILFFLFGNVFYILYPVIHFFTLSAAVSNLKKSNLQKIHLNFNMNGDPGLCHHCCPTLFFRGYDSCKKRGNNDKVTACVLLADERSLCLCSVRAPQ